MEQPFILSIDHLQNYVKVNASLDIKILYPYLDDAYDKYIIPYVGEKLVETITTQNICVEYIKLKEMICRALGPLAVAMASPELGVLIGDSGHTVKKGDHFTVASDKKIARSEESMQERGFANLDKILDYLILNLDKYPEWKESSFFKNKETDRYLNSARAFQYHGKVNIGNSSLTFEMFRPLLSALEMKLRRWIGSALDDSLRKVLSSKEDPVRQELIRNIRVWLAMSIAKLYTSQTTREQRASAGELEFRAVIYPVYADPADNGNFYAEQVTSLETVISDYMITYAGELGLPSMEKTDFNSIDKHIFFAQ